MVDAGGFKQPGNLNRGENFHVPRADLELFHARNRVVGCVTTANGKLERGMYHRAIITIRLRGQRLLARLEAIQPILNIGRGDVASVLPAIVSEAFEPGASPDNTALMHHETF